MNRCSFCEWIPILPWPIWPLAGQLLLGQNVVVGSMTLLLAVRGKHCHEKYVGTPVFFTTALHHGLVWSYLSVNQPQQLCFPPVAGHTLRADFDGGALSSDFGPLLLRGIDR